MRYKAKVLKRFPDAAPVVKEKYPDGAPFRVVIVSGDRELTTTHLGQGYASAWRDAYHWSVRNPEPVTEA